MIIKQSQKVWIKKDFTAFDIAIGSLNGARKCGLMGNYLITGLNNLIAREDLSLCGDRLLLRNKKEVC